jgi:membrane-bound lytic murein transglycosylase D
VTDVRAWNGLKSNYLKPGQKLTIYTPGKVPVATTPVTTDTQQKKAPQTTTPKKVEPKTTTSSTTTTAGTKYKYYTITNGDNLWTVAKKYGTTVDELKKLNGFGDKFVLHTGEKIIVGTL